MKRSRLLLAVAAIGAVVLLVAISSLAPKPASTGLLKPDDVEVTARGRQVYGMHCAACHGAKLEGQPNWRQRDAQGRLPAPPHDATGHTWHHPDETLFRITKFGVAKAANLASYESSMPAYEGVLTDSEIVAALSWIKAQWPISIRAKHDEMNRSSSQQR
jgi:S-disulfanyl-L-cysteine oxidoreductase SoxD